MRKIYISPVTDVYKINIHNIIMTSPGEAGTEATSEDIPNMDQNLGGGSSTGGEWGEELSRDNQGGNSVWDNLW